MSEVNLTYARAHLSELIRRAEAGETIGILRRGKLVACLRPPVQPRKPIDLAEMKAVTDSMPPIAEPIEDFIRKMRDSDRY
jgi:antitoxin (DNA-binding transcriptional repressor) of toxin-antitoxin stability system